MSDFLDLQGAKDLNTDAIHIGAVANSKNPVTGAAIDTHVNRKGGTDYTLQGFWNALGPVVMPWTSVTGGTLTQPNQAFLHPANKNYYSWAGAFPHVVAPGTNPTAVAGYVPRTDVVLLDKLAAPGGAGLVWFQQASSGSVPRPAQDKMREIISVADFGASPANTSAQNDAAFLAASDHVGEDPLFVPAGLFSLSSRDTLPASLLLFGAGRIRFDVWEEVRRFDGGTQKYSWSVYFSARSDCHIYVDGVEVALTWLSDRTVQYTSAATPTTTNVVFRVYGAVIHLGDTPTNVVLDSVYSEIPRDISQAFGHSGTNGRDSGTALSNASYGPKALMSLTTGSGNTVYGNRAGASIKDGSNHVLMGFQAGHRIVTGQGNTGIGTIALEHLTDGQFNTAVGFNSQGSKPSGSNNTSFGAEAMWSWGNCNNNTAMGYRAMANGAGSGENNVAVGTFSQDYAAGFSNTSVGYRALNAEGGILTGNDNVAVGAFAARNLRGSAGGCTVIGSLALNKEASTGDLTAVGFMSLNSNLGGFRNSGVGAYTLQTNVTGNDNTAIGWSGQKTATGNQNTSVGSRTQENATTGDNNTTLGFEAGRNRSTGSANTLVGTRAGREIGANNDNTALGSDALQFLTSGANNTAIGRSALRLMQDVTNATTISNCTGVGANARVSGSNQVQLGDAAATTYVYGTVQNRSDARDKTDCDDTKLGIEFIMGLRPVDGRWDMREDYTEEYQVRAGIDENDEPVFETRVRKLPKDGSKKRERFHHWFIAQEVKELCDSLGVEFGGYQDHSINGGCDVLSLGYDEFIPPITKAIQQCWQRMDDIERRLDKLDPPEVSS